MSSLTGQGLADYGKSKKGTPYFYGSKMSVLTETFMKQMHSQYPKTVTSAYMKKAKNKGQVGRVNTDCSGLISAYTKKVLGSSQLYQTAYARLSVKDYKSWANGVIAWRSGHVGIFFKENGKYYVAEAKGIDYGTVISEFSPSNWSYGLTFSYIDYTYTDNVIDGATWKSTNPYKEPTAIVKRGSKGTDVKWVQWELREAGYDRAFVYKGKTYSAVKIDGDAGKITDAAIRSYQASCKIQVDGKVGKTTREYLKK